VKKNKAFRRCVRELEDHLASLESHVSELEEDTAELRKENEAVLGSDDTTRRPSMRSPLAPTMMTRVARAVMTATLSWTSTLLRLLRGGTRGGSPPR
jgi:hypothetical protein